MKLTYLGSTFKTIPESLKLFPDNPNLGFEIKVNFHETYSSEIFHNISSFLYNNQMEKSNCSIVIESDIHNSGAVYSIKDIESIVITISTQLSTSF